MIMPMNPLQSWALLALIFLAIGLSIWTVYTFLRERAERRSLLVSDLPEGEQFQQEDEPEKLAEIIPLHPATRRRTHRVDSPARHPRREGQFYDWARDGI